MACRKYNVSSIAHRAATCAVLVLAVAACGDDDAGFDVEPDTLEEAVRSTLDRRTADYMMFLAEGSVREIGPFDAMERPWIVDREVDTGGSVDGQIDLRDGHRRVGVTFGGQERDLVVDADALYVELDAGMSDGTPWGRVGLDRVVGAEVRGGLTADAIFTMHDPGAVLRALSDATLAPLPEMAAATDDGLESRRATFAIAVDAIDDRFIEIYGEREDAASLEIHVWIEPGEDGEVDVRRLAYDLGLARGDLSGRIEPGDPPAVGTTGLGPFLVVEFEEIGQAGEIMRPGEDQISEVDVTEIAGLFGMYVFGDATGTLVPAEASGDG